MSTAEQHDNRNMISLALDSLARNQFDELQELLDVCHPSENALLIESVPIAQRSTLISLLSEESVSAVLPLLPDDVRQQLLVQLEAPRLVAG